VRVTDGKGRTVNFKNCVIVMTSNVGSRRILEVCRNRGPIINGGMDSPFIKKEAAMAVSSASGPLEPEFILKRMQDNPKVASLIMKASTDGGVMEGIRTAMNGSPADLLKAAKSDPALAQFLQNVWNEISEEELMSSSTSASQSGLDAIRSSTEKRLPADNDDMDSLYLELSAVVKEELETAMRPELLNRIDEIVVFSPLSSSNLYNIAVRNVDLIIQRATEEHLFSIDVDERLIGRIVEEGSSNADQFGARPMRRAAQRYVEDSLSEAIIGGFLQEGSLVKLSLGEYTSRGKPSVTVECAGKLLNVEIEDDSGGIGTTTSRKAGDD
jgi:ATP-dependent Clp protease ATP-binding subunit ClpA